MRLDFAKFRHRKAYLIGFEKETMGLQALDNVDRDLAIVKEGLLRWGFQHDEIQTFKDDDDLPDFADEELARVQRLSEQSERSGEKILIFMYYKGHANLNDGQVRPGCAQAIGQTGDVINIEEFLVECAEKEYVYTIGLFDCCRRNKESSKRVTLGKNMMNVATIYREQVTDFEPRIC